MCSQRCLTQHRFWYYRTQTCRSDIGSLCERSFKLLQIVSDMFWKSSINLPFIRSIIYPYSYLPTYLSPYYCCHGICRLSWHQSFSLYLCVPVSLSDRCPCISVYYCFYLSLSSVCLSFCIAVYPSVHLVFQGYARSPCECNYRGTDLCCW